jgi:hypothetical protein
MAAEQLDIEIEQGSTFEWLILVRGINGAPLDMTNYVGGTAGARGHIRKTYSDLNPMAIFSISTLNKTGVLQAISNGILHLDQPSIDALVSDGAGKCYLLVRLSASDTAGISTKGVYDIEIEDTYGYVFKPYRGAVGIAKEATK